MARPRVKIDPEQVRALAEHQWNVSMISSFLNVSDTTVTRRCGEALRKGRHAGQAKLIEIAWSRILGNDSRKVSDRILIYMMERFLGPIHKQPPTEGDVTIYSANNMQINRQVPKKIPNIQLLETILQQKLPTTEVKLIENGIGKDTNNLERTNP